MKQFHNLLYVLLIMFTAACVGNPGSEEDPGGDTDGALTLNTSAAYIINDGTDAALFTVLKGKKDVTADAKIYQKKEVLSSCYLQLHSPLPSKVLIRFLPVIMVRCLKILL